MDILKSLKKRITNLEYYKFPNFYISNYFDDLKTKVDYLYNDSIFNQKKEHNREKLKEKWVKVINKINELCEECLSNVKQIKFNYDLDSNIKTIQDKFNSLEEFTDKSFDSQKFNSIINDLDCMIYELENKIGQNLIKKSAAFIDAKSYKKVVKVFRTKFYKNLKIPGQLLVFKDFFINNKAIDELISNETDYSEKQISYEYVVCDEIKENFRNHTFEDYCPIIREINGDFKLVKKIEILSEIYSIDENAFDEFINLNTIFFCFYSFPFKRLIQEFNNAVKKLNFLEKLSLIFFPEFEIDLSIMFKDLTNLIELEVEISEIKTIHPSAFESLINLKLLVLSSNLISSVDENLFKECVNLDSLLLDYNKLNNIHQNAFKNCKKLRFLNLEKNEIESINNVFKGLTNLQNILLSNNKIKTIESNSFRDLTNLETIDLNQNEIQFLPVNLFKDLKNLKVIDLKKNKIKFLEKDVFSNCYSLNELYLSQNELNLINENVFDGLINLKTLKLDCNRLNNIPDHLFADLKNLTSINLASNNIEYLQDNVFEGLSSIQLIELKFNNLSCISKKAFSFISNSKEIKINLAENNLIELDLSIFDENNGLNEIMLYNNPIVKSLDDILAKSYHDKWRNFYDVLLRK